MGHCQRICRESNIIYIETSAKTSQEIQSMFMIGVNAVLRKISIIKDN